MRQSRGLSTRESRRIADFLRARQQPLLAGVLRHRFFSFPFLLPRRRPAVSLRVTMQRHGENSRASRNTAQFASYAHEFSRADAPCEVSRECSRSFRLTSPPKPLLSCAPIRRTWRRVNTSLSAKSDAFRRAKEFTHDFLITPRSLLVFNATRLRREREILTSFSGFYVEKCVRNAGEKMLWLIQQICSLLDKIKCRN